MFPPDPLTPSRHVYHVFNAHGERLAGPTQTEHAAFLGMRGARLGAVASQESIMDDRERKAIGILAEELALAHLLDHGLRLLSRNYRCKLGEIDLVMLHGKTLVLVEVRCRASHQYGGAAASITWQKQRKLAKTAEHLLMKNPQLRRHPARFDVVAIMTDSAAPQIEWIKSAFSL
jgi:putative endonuclease